MLFNIFLTYAAFALAPIVGFLVTWKKKPTTDEHMGVLVTLALIALIYSSLWVFLEVPIRATFGAVPTNPETVLDFLPIDIAGMGSVLYIVFSVLSVMVLYTMGAITGWLATALEDAFK